jgi:hypothetical protein
MPAIKLENSDFNNICELLETCKMRFAAKTYDCTHQSIHRFLLVRGTSHKIILRAYRVKVIADAIEREEPSVITAKELKLSLGHFSTLRKRLFPDFKYWHHKKTGVYQFFNYAKIETATIL